MQVRYKMQDVTLQKNRLERFRKIALADSAAKTVEGIKKCFKNYTFKMTWKINSLKKK